MTRARVKDRVRYYFARVLHNFVWSFTHSALCRCTMGMVLALRLGSRLGLTSALGLALRSAL